jgi:two-component system chemotaxis sensor kinase CheA
LSRDKNGLLRFFQEAEGIVLLLSHTGEHNDELCNSLHTLKGNAGLFGFSLLAECCHAAEDAIAEDSLDRRRVDAVIERFDALRKTFTSLAGGDSSEQVEVSRTALRALAARIATGMSARDASQAVGHLLLEPLARPLSRLGQHACALSRRLGKGELSVKIADGGLLTDPLRGNALFAALVHLIRNAVDHGFETAEERLERGKGPPALSLSASVTESEVSLEIKDDGRGIDWKRVRALAEERGLASASEEALVSALFAPEFSTRATVSATSGRGVGLSAVRSEVERLAGRIEVASEKDRGTNFRLCLPLEALGIRIPAPSGHLASPLSRE